MALALGALGVPDEAIVDDYAQSEDAYKAMGDRTAMVGALAQVSVVSVSLPPLWLPRPLCFFVFEKLRSYLGCGWRALLSFF